MRVLRAGFLPLSLLILVAAALVVPLPYYLETPGRTVSLAACVDVAVEDSTLAGDFLLTTINVLPATTVDMVVGIADPGTTVVPRRQLLPPGVDTDAFFEEQRNVFISTADLAAAVGLEAAGHQVELDGDGVEVVRVQPGTPAADVLRVGDVVLAVAGRRVRIDTQLREIIGGSEVGVPLDLRVRRGEDTLNLQVAPENIQGMPVIGIQPQTLNPRINLPFEVDVATGPIGGPSAGLMIALTVYDKALADIDLAAGRVVAGTGSIDADGRVGPIGGIELKVVAADRQGADVFLAPVADLQRANAAVPAGSSLRVVPVESFDQARQALTETAGEISRSDDRPTGQCPYRAADGEAEGSGAGDHRDFASPTEAFSR